MRFAITCVLVGIAISLGCSPKPRTSGKAEPAARDQAVAPGDPPIREELPEPVLPPDMAAALGEPSGEDEAARDGKTRRTAKARKPDYGKGMVTTPLAAYITAQDQLRFEFPMKQAMQVFEALNGRLPRSHEEFMEKVINQYGIPLPELPANERYVYDPKRGELMVEHEP